MRRVGGEKSGVVEHLLDVGEREGFGSVQDGRWIERGNEDRVQIE